MNQSDIGKMGTADKIPWSIKVHHFDLRLHKTIALWKRAIFGGGVEAYITKSC